MNKIKYTRVKKAATKKNLERHDQEKSKIELKSATSCANVKSNVAKRSVF